MAALTSRRDEKRKQTGREGVQRQDDDLTPSLRRMFASHLAPSTHASPSPSTSQLPSHPFVLAPDPILDWTFSPRFRVRLGGQDVETVLRLFEAFARTAGIEDRDVVVLPARSHVHDGVQVFTVSLHVPSTLHRNFLRALLNVGGPAPFGSAADPAPFDVGLRVTPCNPDARVASTDDVKIAEWISLGPTGLLDCSLWPHGQSDTWSSALSARLARVFVALLRSSILPPTGDPPLPPDDPAAPFDPSPLLAFLSSWLDLSLRLVAPFVPSRHLDSANRIKEDVVNVASQAIDAVGMVVLAIQGIAVVVVSLMRSTIEGFLGPPLASPLTADPQGDGTRSPDVLHHHDTIVGGSDEGFVPNVFNSSQDPRSPRTPTKQLQTLPRIIRTSPSPKKSKGSRNVSWGSTTTEVVTDPGNSDEGDCLTPTSGSRVLSAGTEEQSDEHALQSAVHGPSAVAHVSSSSPYVPSTPSTKVNPTDTPDTVATGSSPEFSSPETDHNSSPPTSPEVTKSPRIGKALMSTGTGGDAAVQTKSAKTPRGPTAPAAGTSSKGSKRIPIKKPTGSSTTLSHSSKEFTSRPKSSAPDTVRSTGQASQTITHHGLGLRSADGHAIVPPLSASDDFSLNAQLSYPATSSFAGQPWSSHAAAAYPTTQIWQPSMGQFDYPYSSHGGSQLLGASAYPSFQVTPLQTGLFPFASSLSAEATSYSQAYSLSQDLSIATAAPFSPVAGASPGVADPHSKGLSAWRPAPSRSLPKLSKPAASPTLVRPPLPAEAKPKDWPSPINVPRGPLSDTAQNAAAEVEPESSQDTATAQLSADGSLPSWPESDTTPLAELISPLEAPSRTITPRPASAIGFAQSPASRPAHALRAQSLDFTPITSHLAPSAVTPTSPASTNSADPGPQPLPVSYASAASACVTSVKTTRLRSASGNAAGWDRTAADPAAEDADGWGSTPASHSPSTWDSSTPVTIATTQTTCQSATETGPFESGWVAKEEPKADKAMDWSDEVEAEEALATAALRTEDTDLETALPLPPQDLLPKPGSSHQDSGWVTDSAPAAVDQTRTETGGWDAPVLAVEEDDPWTTPTVHAEQRFDTLGEDGEPKKKQGFKKDRRQFPRDRQWAGKSSQLNQGWSPPNDGRGQGYSGKQHDGFAGSSNEGGHRRDFGDQGYGRNRYEQEGDRKGRWSFGQDRGQSGQRGRFAGGGGVQRGKCRAYDGNRRSNPEYDRGEGDRSFRDQAGGESWAPVNESHKVGTDRWATDDRSPPSLAVGYGNAGLDHGWTTGVRSPHTVDSTDNSFPALSPARTPSPTYFGSDEHRQAEEQRLLHQSIQQGTSTLDPQTLTRQTGWPTKKKKQPKKKVGAHARVDRQPSMSAEEIAKVVGRQ